MGKKITDTDILNPTLTVVAETNTKNEKVAENSPASTSIAHCPYRRTTDLLQCLAPNKMRVGFFLCAGCSLSVKDNDGTPLIPEIVGLTKLVKLKSVIKLTARRLRKPRHLDTFGNRWPGRQPLEGIEGLKKLSGRIN